MDILKELEEAKWETLQEQWDRFLLSSFYTTQKPMWRLMKSFCNHNNLKFEEAADHLKRIPIEVHDWHSCASRYIAKNFVQLNNLLYKYADRHVDVFDQLLKKFSKMAPAINPEEKIRMQREGSARHKEKRKYRNALTKMAIELKHRDATYKSNWKTCT